jgi:hypothetical protein
LSPLDGRPATSWSSPSSPSIYIWSREIGGSWSSPRRGVRLSSARGESISRIATFLCEIHNRASQRLRLSYCSRSVARGVNGNVLLSTAGTIGEAGTTRSYVTSLRTVCASNVLPPALASNAAHALPVVRPSLSSAAAGLVIDQSSIRFGGAQPRGHRSPCLS